MPIQKSTAISGAAKQTARGTLAANPAFIHGVSGGQQISVEVDQSILDVTTGKRTGMNVIRAGVKNGGSVESPAYMKSLGLYLLAALGTVTTTGAGPYVHTFATGDLPYLSMFSKGIDSTIQAIRDCKVDELTLKWDGVKPLELSVKYIGTVFTFPSTFVGTVDEIGAEAFLIPVGGTFAVDVAGSVPVNARITKGELTIKNSLEAITQSADLESVDVFEGRQELSLKLTAVPDSLSDWRKTLTGSANGERITASVPMGSVSLAFKENAGTGGLMVTGSKVAFLTSFPDADPKGGAVELELSGMAVTPAGGVSPLTFALTNTQQSY